MTRILLAPVTVALAFAAGLPAQAATSLPGIGQCVRVVEPASQVGFQVCTPPIG